MAELVGAVVVAEYVFELPEALDVLDVTGTLEVLDELNVLEVLTRPDMLDVIDTLGLTDLLKLLEVLELLEATLIDGLVTTPNSAALVHGPRFPASVYAMILTYLARASGKESVLKSLVSG